MAKYSPAADFRFNPGVLQSFVVSGLVLYLLACVATTAAGQVVNPGTQGLRTTAVSLLSTPGSEGVVLTDPPLVEIRDGKMRYQIGSAYVRRDQRDELARDLPIQLLEAQLRIELLRRYLSREQPKAMPFWERYLVQAENILANALDIDGAERRGDEARERALALAAEDAELVLEQAALIFASDNKILLVKNDTTREKLVTVSFVSDPQGGEMYIVGDFLFRAAKQRLDESLWLDITHGNPVSIPAGDWRYRARWARSSTWQTGIISIEESRTYNILRKTE